MGPTLPDVNIAVVVGSNRRASINGKLARALAKLADRKLAVNFVRIDDLPMYNQDLQVPLPASVARFNAEIERADSPAALPRRTWLPPETLIARKS
jgi:chromate reductase